MNRANKSPHDLQKVRQINDLQVEWFLPVNQDACATMQLRRLAIGVTGSETKPPNVVPVSNAPDSCQRVGAASIALR